MGKNKKYINKFNLDWLKHGDYKIWLQAVESCDTLAYCKLCNNQFDVGSMRMSALTSHRYFENYFDSKKTLEEPPLIWCNSRKNKIKS